MGGRQQVGDPGLGVGLVSQGSGGRAQSHPPPQHLVEGIEIQIGLGSWRENGQEHT